jgi:glycosyltransferase involved in cell wall biosynthesis
MANARHLPWLLGELLRSGPRLTHVITELERLRVVERRIEEFLTDELHPMLHALVAEDAENRRRLHRLRESPCYEAAFDDPEPLVTVTVATRNRAELLRTRSLPSILGQSHSDLEVIVVGDHEGPEAAEAIASLDDQRVTYRNLTQRTVASDDPQRHWLVGATMTRNEANRTATGRWLVPFDDDDAMRPGHIETLLDRAREGRLEVCYGGFRMHRPDGSSEDYGAFPPRRHQFAWPGAIEHAGLRFFERELVSAALGTPGDWFLLERMLRAGVRFGHVDRLVFDYYPSQLPAEEG